MSEYFDIVVSSTPLLLLLLFSMGNNDSRIEPGDILYRDNKIVGLANHYGVYIGEEGVIDFSREGVRLSSFGDFAGQYEIHIRRYLCHF